MQKKKVLQFHDMIGERYRDPLPSHVKKREQKSTEFLHSDEEIAVIDGVFLNKNLIHLTLPLTPTANELAAKNKSSKSRMSRGGKRIFFDGLAGVKEKAKFAVIRSLRAAGFDGHYRLSNDWAGKIMISAIRCGIGKRADVSNVVGGLKFAEDALVFDGIVSDDGPDQVAWGPCHSRAKADWGGELVGPATHLFILRMALVGGAVICGEREARLQMMSLMNI